MPDGGGDLFGVALQDLSIEIERWREDHFAQSAEREGSDERALLKQPLQLAAEGAVLEGGEEGVELRE